MATTPQSPNSPSVVGPGGTALTQGVVRTSRFIPLILPAGTIQRVPQAGTKFYIVSQDKTQIDIGIKTDETVEEFYRKGTGKNVPEDQFFTALEVRNTSLTLSVTLVIFAGFGDFIDNRLNVVSVDEGLYLPVMEGRTRVASWTGVSLAAAPGPGDTLDVDGVTPLAAPPAGYTDVKRQSVILTNNDALLWLDLQDSAGNTFMRLLAGKQIELPVSEFVRVRNTNGAAISCNFGEIWTVIKS